MALERFFDQICQVSSFVMNERVFITKRLEILTIFTFSFDIIVSGFTGFYCILVIFTKSY